MRLELIQNLPTIAGSFHPMEGVTPLMTAQMATPVARVWPVLS